MEKIQFDEILRPAHYVAGRKYITTKEIAEWLNVNRTTVYNLVQNDRLPCYRIGSRYRFNSSEVLEWMNAHVNRQAEDGEGNGSL